MSNFIEDYLKNPSLAISAASRLNRTWYEEVDEETVYAQLASPEFRLYEQITFCQE